MEKTRSFRSLLEVLKIVSKNWNIKIDGWEVQVNDKVEHSLYQRIQRTNLDYKDLKEKIILGIKYVINKANKENMYALYYKKSDFTILLLVKPETKFVRLSTILDSGMQFKGGLKWDINEFKNDFPEIDISDFNINTAGYLLEGSFLVEPDIDTKDTKLAVYSELFEHLNIDL